MGCPLPVRSRRSRVQPIRCSFLRPYPRILLHGRSSPGVRPSYTVCPAILRSRPLGREHLSWGFLAPSTLEEEGIHVPEPVKASGSLVVPGGAPAGPNPPTTVPLSGFLNLSAACSSLRPPAISDGWRSWGSPFRDLVLPRSPGGSSPSACPRDVHRLQGLRPRENRSCPRVTVSSPRTNLSLLVFRLLMV